MTTKVLTTISPACKLKIYVVVEVNNIKNNIVGDITKHQD